MASFLSAAVSASVSSARDGDVVVSPVNDTLPVSMSSLARFMLSAAPLATVAGGSPLLRGRGPGCSEPRWAIRACPESSRVSPGESRPTKYLTTVPPSRVQELLGPCNACKICSRTREPGRRYTRHMLVGITAGKMPAFSGTTLRSQFCIFIRHECIALAHNQSGQAN